MCKKHLGEHVDQIPDFSLCCKRGYNRSGLKPKNLILYQLSLLVPTPGDSETIQRPILKNTDPVVLVSVTLTLYGRKPWEPVLQIVHFNLYFFIYLEFQSDLVKHVAPEIRCPAFKAWLHHLQCVYLKGTYSVFLYLCFLISKTGNIVSTCFVNWHCM